MLKRLFCVGAALFVGSQAGGQTTTESSMDLSAIQQKALKSEVVVLDVREQDEWDDGHLKVARLIPLSVLQDEAACAKAIADLDKEIPIYCHCKAGIRAKYGADILQRLGFEVTAMTMKYEAIVASGFEESDGP